MEKELWFKRRRYGWGWTPVNWKGWFSIIVYLGIVFGSLYYFYPEIENEDQEIVFIYLAIVIISTFLLALVSYIKGPNPKWRWGKSQNDEPDKDF